MLRIFAVMAWAIGALVTSAPAEAKCGSGQITCEQWCNKYRPGAVNCFTGPRSCAEKPQGNKACVDDRCNSRNDSCDRQAGTVRPGKRARAGETCSFENEKCLDYCRNSPAGRAQGRSCSDTCNARQRVCLKTGVYEWRNSPNVTGLERR